MLEVNITVTIPTRSTGLGKPTSAINRTAADGRVRLCENNTNLFDYHMPVADMPDF